MESKIKIFQDGFRSGTFSVLEFLKEVKNIDFEKEFEAWSNCDYYYNWKGEKIGCDTKFAISDLNDSQDKNIEDSDSGSKGYAKPTLVASQSSDEKSSMSQCESAEDSPDTISEEVEE